MIVRAILAVVSGVVLLALASGNQLGKKEKKGIDTTEEERAIAVELAGAHMLVREAEARLKNAQAGFDQGKISIDEMESAWVTVHEFRARLEMLAIVEIRLAARNRARRLFETGKASKEDVERATKAYEKAKERSQQFGK